MHTSCTNELGMEIAPWLHSKRNLWNNLLQEILFEETLPVIWQQMLPRYQISASTVCSSKSCENWHLQKVLRYTYNEWKQSTSVQFAKCVCVWHLASFKETTLCKNISLTIPKEKILLKGSEMSLADQGLDQADLHRGGEDKLWLLADLDSSTAK